MRVDTLTETSPASFLSETEKQNNCNTMNNDSGIHILFYVIKEHVNVYVESGSLIPEK